MAKILKFETECCGQCKEATRRMIKAGIIFDTVLCDEAEGDDMAKYFGVKSVPTVIVTEYDGTEYGNEVMRFTGLGDIQKNLNYLKEMC